MRSHDALRRTAIPDQDHLDYHSTGGNLLIEILDHLLSVFNSWRLREKESLPDIEICKRDPTNFNEREFEESVITGLD